MRTAPFSLALLVPLLLLAPAGADCTPTRSDRVTSEMVGVMVPGSRAALGTELYVVTDVCQDDVEDPCLFSVWFYMEMNGVPGLQRGDEVHTDVDCGAGPDGLPDM